MNSQSQSARKAAAKLGSHGMAGANIGPSIRSPVHLSNTSLPQYYVVAVMLSLLWGYHPGQRLLKFLTGTEEVTGPHYLNQQLL